MRMSLMALACVAMGCAPSLQGDGFYGCARSGHCPASAPVCGADGLCHASSSMGNDAATIADGGSGDSALAPLTYPDCDGTVAGSCAPDFCAYDPVLGNSANGYCTRHCTTDAECPAFRGSTSACLGGQCARGCTSSLDCPDGLSCSAGRWQSGATLRLCVSLVIAEADWYDTCQMDVDCQQPLSCVNGYCLRACASTGDCVEFLETCITSAAGPRGCLFQCSTASECNSLSGQCSGGGCHPHPGW